MLVCPLCGQKNEMGETTCARCGEDLSLYSKIYYAPDVLFNMAAGMMEQGEYGAAAELLLTANRLKPADQDILNLLIDLYVKEENYEKAIEKCLQILEINPEDERANRLVEDLAERINVQADKKQKASAFLQKTVSELYTQTTGDMLEPGSVLKSSEASKETPTSAGLPEETSIKPDDASVPEWAEKVSSARQKTNRWLIIGTAVLVLFMALGFGAVYLKLTENISVQTNMWAKSTEGKLTQIAESLEEQVKHLKTEMDALKIEQAGQTGEISEQQEKLRDLMETLKELKESTQGITVQNAENQQAAQSLSKELELVKEQMDAVLEKLEEIGVKEEKLP